MKFTPPAQEGATVEEVKLACLRVGPAFYALDIMGIREIIRPVTIMQVPKAPTYIDGVITLRKAVIPVVDLRRRFGVSPKNEPRERIIISAVDGKIIGLQVDEVTEVISVPRDEIQPSPYYMAGTDTEFFPAVCRYANKLLLLIDLRKVLSSDQKIDAEKVQQKALESTTKD